MKARDAFLAAREKEFIGQHQLYYLDVLDAPSSATADVFEFEGTEAIGDVTRYTIRWTHSSHELSPREYIGKMGSFLIQPPTLKWGKPESPRRKYGVVTAFAKLSTSKDQSTYEAVLESRLSILRNAKKVRFFHHMSEPEVIRQILKEHNFNQIWARFEISLYRSYSKRDIITQWEEDDFAFVQRLCRRTGIWFVSEEGEHCEVVRFGDDLTHYRRDASHENHQFPILFQPEAGMNTRGIESVKSLEMRARSIPSSYHVRSYNYRQAPYPIEATEEFHPKSGDSTMYGEQYIFGLPVQNKEDAGRQALLRQEEALAQQIEYQGKSDALDMAPGRVYQFSNHRLTDAKYGLLITKTICSASRAKGYEVRFTAIPCDRLYRMPLQEYSWPKIGGTITGTIASTEGYSGPFLDQHGEYVVEFHANRDPRLAGLNSCLLRLAKPFAGKYQTGFHFGLLPGSEVAVAFFMGNPDLPYILHALHNSKDTDAVNSEHKWRTRNVIHTERNNTLQFEDRINQEHVKLSTEYGKSQLNLGHVVDSKGEPRGFGYELRSDMKGVVRAGDGLLLTAEAQVKATGKTIDMTRAEQVLNVTEQQAQGLAQAASLAKADSPDLRAEIEWLKSELAGLKKPVVAVSAPAGVAIATPDRVMIAANKDITNTASGRFSVNAMKGIALAASEAVSIFAHKLGVKLFAARGPVRIQAQSDVMELVAEKNMQLCSVNGTLTANASNGVVLSGGGSAYIKIQGDNVEIGGTGRLILKIIDIKKDGPGALTLPKPHFDQIDISNDERYVLSDQLTGRPLSQKPYKITLANGEVVEGMTNAAGETSVTKEQAAQGIRMVLKRARKQ
ncbi:type VI secretion system Vgr family protein [Caballeronia arvi]|uniref:type VI secretion system Vgr family protein n=1 Tax=Caballeronia arvi TaxID=1777135 RepID=UPI000772B579|nr:type VI secretion system Vgr family protein [Caballeronia arvi]